MIFRLIKAQRARGNEILLWARDEFGDKIHFIIDEFRPYFFSSEPIKDFNIISCESGYKSVFGEPIFKITCKNPSNVVELRLKCKNTWEADLQYPRRWLINAGISSYFNDYFISETPPEIPISLVTAYLDIECYTKPNQTPNPVKDKITCITLGNLDGYATLVLDDVNLITEQDNSCILHFADEKDMLTCLSKIIYDTDCVCAWNSEFDFGYLYDRCKALNVEFSLNGVCDFDLLMADRILHRRRSYKLKDVVLEEKLTDVLEENVDYAYMYDQEREKLIERNQKHVRWICELDAKLKMSEYYIGVKELAGLESLEGTTHNSVIIETMLLRRAQGALPTKQDRVSQTFEGAYVMQPQAGIYFGVAEADMSRFYPSVILSEMLDPIILWHYRKTHSGNINWIEYKKFASEYKGNVLILSLVTELIEERNRLEKSSEHKSKIANVKGVTNSLYGVFASPHFRLFDIDIAAKITETARDIIKSVQKQIEEKGYKVIYGDTDSSYCLVPKEKLPEFLTQLNEIVKTHGEYNMKLENYYTSMLFTGAKKRKAGIDDKGMLHFTGFERVKSDSSNITRRVQETVIRMALENRKNEIMPYIKKVIAEIKTAPVTDIAISKQLSKNLEEYTGPQINYIKELRDNELPVKAGDSVKIIPVKNSKTGVFVYLDDTDIPSNIQINFDEIIRIQIKSKVEDILEVCGLEFEDTSGQVKLF